MALVHDDEVEEGWVETPEDLLAVLPNQLLVEGKIDLVGRIELAMLDLGGDILERREIAILGLVHEDVAVCKIEDLTCLTSLAEAVDDLEGCVGLARTGCHDKEDPVTALGHCLDHAVDCVALIVARLVAAVLIVVGRGHHGHSLVV